MRDLGGRRWLARLAVVLYGAFVAYMSLRRFGSSDVERAIDTIGRAYFHLPAYAGLAALVALALNPLRPKGRRVVLALVLATGYGWLLEVAQIATPTRTFNVLGLVFDAAGAVAGGAAMFLFFLWRERVRRRA